MVDIRTNSKYTLTVKDVILILIFLGAVGVNIFYSVSEESFAGVSTIIEQTIILTLSFVGLIEVASHIGWTLLVPDFFEYGLEKRRKQEIQVCMDEYFIRDKNFINNYNHEQIEFILSQLGINIKQLEKIHLELIRMRCMPLKSIEDAQEKLRLCIKTGDPLVINQDDIDSSQLVYTSVKYYINLTDAMYIPDYCQEFASILTFLINENQNLSSFDKIVIPHDSNFLLGVEVAKRLGKPVVKIRHDKGRVKRDQRWDGNLKGSDRVIIVHDVLVTSEQVKHALNVLPKSCLVVGFFCIIARQEWDGVKQLENRNLPVRSVITLNDEDICDLLKEK